MNILFIVFGAILGSAFGSFACCQAWRIRLKEKGKKSLGNRSVCMKCEKKLTWYENIPILSWIIQKGKCRKCGARIGKAEIIAEVFGAISFALIAWKFLSAEAVDYIGLLLVVPIMIGLLLIAVYDGKWGEMPVDVLVFTIVVSLAYGIVETVAGGGDWSSLIGSVALLAGTYYLLYFFSKETLVGGGDWMLCLAIGLVLGHWQLAILELFLSNFLGAIYMLPNNKRKVAFGPFLVLGFVIVFSFGNVVLELLHF